jgi:hypothetical protein
MKGVETVPHIRTFESDIFNSTRSDKGADRITILSDQLDVQGMVNMQDKKHKAFLILTSVLVCCFVLGSAFAAYYIYVEKNKSLPVKALEVKRYYVSDLFKEVKSIYLLKSFTSEATSSKNVFDDKLSYVINISNFDNLYEKIITQESIISDIAKIKYSYVAVSDFKDVTIQNIDMRIADGEEGLIVYGFFKKEKLIISNNINEYLKLYKGL